MRKMPERPPDHGEELLDLVDEQNRVKGTVRREKVHGNPSLRHRAVHVFIVNGKGEIYLQKRGIGKLVQPGKWDTSVGGHLSSGQTYEEAAKREMKEELGIDDGKMPALRFSHEYVWETGFETEHIRTFVAESEGPFCLDSVEIEEGRFWTREELGSAIGSGKLSPNLEAELRYLGIEKT